MSKRELIITARHLREGDEIYNQGYLFAVSSIRLGQRNGRDHVEFTGACTKDSINNPIRNTGYDGARYGRYANEIVNIRREEP